MDSFWVRRKVRCHSVTLWKVAFMLAGWLLSSGNALFTNSSAVSRETNRPSSCASSTASRISRNLGPGAYPAAIKSSPVTKADRANLLRRNLGQLLPDKFVGAQIAVAGQAVGAVQREMLVEAGQAQEFLQRRFLHARDMAEAHVIVDQRENLRGVVIREAQAPADFFGNLDAHIHMIIEADAVGSHAKRRRLAHIVQQRAPGQRGRARTAADCPAAAACAQTRRPRDETPAAAATPFIAEISGSTSFSRPLSSSSRNARRRMALGEHFREFVANPLARHHLNFVRQALDCGQRLRLRSHIRSAPRSAPRAACAICLLAKRRSGSPMVRIIPASRSLRPPTKSSTSPLTGSSIMPLMVKSRRATSSRGSWLKRTSSGCRPSE